MKGFLKYLIGTVVGCLVAILAGVLIASSILGGAVDGLTGSKKPTVVEPNTTLVISFDQPLADRETEPGLGSISPANFAGNGGKPMGLNLLLRNIAKAKADDNIRGILLRPDRYTGGAAFTEEIRAALADFRQSGKFVHSYADIYTHNSYYLATAGDKIYIAPEGVMQWSGLAGRSVFFRRTLQKLGVEPQVVRHGKFKSAVEPYLLDKMSPENREQTATYINGIWGNMVAAAAQARGIDAADLQRFADNLEVFLPQEAADRRMVDAVWYYDQVAAEIKTLTDTAAEGDFRAVDYASYQTVPDPADSELIVGQPKIAVVYASGEIGSGKGSATEIGVENVSKALAEARDDDEVKAIVLRVNSPGGSAITSELILREAKLAQAKKPLVVSMGEYAASGGYYISCAADTIVANPSTLTGSIGVFGLSYNIEKLLDKHLGVSVDVVGSAAHADVGTMARPMDDMERARMQRMVESVYGTFVGHVGQARGMAFDQVDAIGQGRVWSGLDAKRINLVDVHGGLTDAVRIAAQMAGADGYRVTELPKAKSTVEQVMEAFGMKAKARPDLGVLEPYAAHVERALRNTGVQARMEYDIMIE